MTIFIQSEVTRYDICRIALKICMRSIIALSESFLENNIVDLNFFKIDQYFFIYIGIHGRRVRF